MREYKKKIRLYTNAPLQIGAQIVLDTPQIHYLANVMRHQQGDQIRLFNGKDGEFLAMIDSISRKNCLVIITEKLRPMPPVQDIKLYFAPVKKQGTDFIIEKATELGVNSLIPILTDYSETRRVNMERWKNTAIEAAEQCERLDLPTFPEIDNLQILDNHIKATENRLCLIAVERAAEQNFHAEKSVLPLLQSLSHHKNQITENGLDLVIGAEGGFSQDELQRWATFKHVAFISLGKNILRAETAAIAGLSIITAFFDS